MVSSTGETIARGPELASVQRPARALIGWMNEDEARIVLAGRRGDRVANPELGARWRTARASVEARPNDVDQADVIAEPPPELSDHIAQLTASGAAAGYLGQGWSIRIADLAQVCALQPVVFWDHAEERTASASTDDIKSIAEVTLPLPRETQLPVQFDKQRMTWLIASRNPNLKFVGEFHTQVAPGVVAFGFAVTVMASFVQVVRYRGRYVLRDGYHRSLGLLARGIRRVPVLFREFAPYEDLGLGAGMLPTAAYLGDRPPFIGDYLDEPVSVPVDLPGSQKMVVVQALEMNPLG